MEQFESDNRVSKVYTKRYVGEIKPDEGNVQILGYATQINKAQEFFLDDKTGKIQVRDIPDETEDIQPNGLYRVLGEIAFDPTGAQYVKAVLIQPLKGFNFQLYQRAENLRKKIP
jgi:hypothetical protein